GPDMIAFADAQKIRRVMVDIVKLAPLASAGLLTEQLVRFIDTEFNYAVLVTRQLSGHDRPMPDRPTLDILSSWRPARPAAGGSGTPPRHNDAQSFHHPAHNPFAPERHRLAGPRQPHDLANQFLGFHHDGEVPGDAVEWNSPTSADTDETASTQEPPGGP